jgi:GT2 family glycosyltransferase
MRQPIDARIAIIVLNWNGSEDTLACLRSLGNSDAATARIVVFDNGSRAEDRTRIGSESGIEFHCSDRNLGFAEGNNEAVRRLGSGASTLVFLNNDTEVPEVWLAPLLELLEERHPCMVSPAILLGEPPRDRQYWFTGTRISWWLGRPVLETAPPGAVPVRLPYIPGCCMAMKRETWDLLGGFDPRYFAYFEDTDLGLRANSAGIGSWIAPDSRIHHKVSRSTGEGNPFRIELFTRNRILFMRRFAPAWSWPSFVIFQVVARSLFSLKYFLRPRGWTRYRAFLRGTLAGFAAKGWP